MGQRVVVLGASPNPERYSNQAVRDLLAHGHSVLPIHPLASEIHGQPCIKSLQGVEETVDTITLYVGAEKSTALMERILHLKPKRIIFNPGSENSTLEQQAQAQHIETVHGCTLVMLRTNQF
jgi:uncharacterized protein